MDIQYSYSDSPRSNNNAKYPFIRVDLRKFWFSTGRVFIFVISRHSTGHILCEVWGLHSIMNSSKKQIYCRLRGIDWFSIFEYKSAACGIWLNNIGCGASRTQHFMVEPFKAISVQRCQFRLSILNRFQKNKTFDSQWDLYLWSLCQTKTALSSSSYNAQRGFVFRNFWPPTML